MGKKVCLIIMDGWGIGNKDKSDAIHSAETPYVDSLYKSFPNATLRTDGEHVGLPNGQMGNSEVGHQNIGAGRVVYQNLVRINNDIVSGVFQQNPTLVQAFEKAKKTNKALHLMGLLGEGGVHASQEHLNALLTMAADYQIEKVFVHVFTDGRDTDPKSGLGYLKNLQQHMKNTTGVVASIIGRYYAMDRDNRWERIKKAYDLLIIGKGKKTSDVVEALHKSYNNNITDEFIEPIVTVDINNNPIGTINEKDIVICTNFRTDRCREISTVLTQNDNPEFGMKKLDIHYLTMTNYNESFKGVEVVYSKEDVKMTLGEFLSLQGKSQVRIAETEKYPHVTFFFSGGRESEFKGEKRLLVNSPKVATYDIQPEMSAQGIVDSISKEIDENKPDFICLNFANADMVGHTGVISAIEKACETVDDCVKQVIDKGLEHDYSFIVIADHGNADFVVNEDGSPNTAHSLNPVPIFVINAEVNKVEDGILADVAPTVLKLMGMEIPEEMTGKVLV